MKVIMLRKFLFLLSLTPILANADRICMVYPQSMYDNLIARANNNDKDAMFMLSGMCCHDCNNLMETCAAPSVKWLKFAAEHGHATAQKYLNNQNQSLQNGLYFTRYKRYFSLGKTLKCLVTKSGSAIWEFDRWKLKEPPQVADALKSGTGYLKSCKS